MDGFGLTFHHLGLAVTNAAKAINFVRGMAYTIGEVVYDDLQNVNLIMCTHSIAPGIEIIYAHNDYSPLESVLKQQREMIYHICYQTADLAETLSAIKKAGNRITCVSSPKPAVLFFGQCVSFYYVSGFGLIEILEGE